VSDRNSPEHSEDAEDDSTDVGEGQRGVVTPSRGGTFDATPGESGDNAGAESGAPNSPIPHLQEE